MEILIGSLLFITSFFTNFLELNSSPEPSGAGSSRYPLNFGATALQPLPSFQVVHIKFLGKDIKVSLRSINNQYVPFGTSVEGIDDSGIPDYHSRHTQNFVCCAAFNRDHRNEIKIVVYYTEHESGLEKGIPFILGAKLPPTQTQIHRPDDPKRLDPNISTWFIIYSAKEYVVRGNIDTGEVTGIYPQKRSRASNIWPDREYYRRNPATEDIYVKFGGIYFLLFKRRGSILGVMLDPHWMYREGEPLANLIAELNPNNDPHPHLLPDPYIHLYQHQNISRYLNPNPDPNLNPHLSSPHQIPHQARIHQHLDHHQHQNPNADRNRNQGLHSDSNEILQQQQYSPLKKRSRRLDEGPSAK